MTRTDKRIAVITGGSRGIGRAVTLEFCRRGTDVCFPHNDPDDHYAQETEALCRELPGRAFSFRMDVADESQVSDFFKQVAEKDGALAYLVNNAGITRDQLLMRMKKEDWDRVISINLTGTFLCIKAASRIMMGNRFGRIVNLASVVAFSGNAGQANYSASKAGVLGLTRSAARELAPRNITVNAVAPGFIETDMTSGLPEKVRAQILENTPLARMGTPEDVAAAVLFLCSDAASFITGQVIAVNGGLYM
ncbi:MAG: 3-oxoacyl-[acyl-carrier-protein] reductase [Thermodesulfobacteriota bacterium]